MKVSESVVLKIAIEGVRIRLSWYFRVFAFLNGDLNSVMEKSTFFFIWVMCNKFELRPVILVYLTLLPPISQNWHYKLPPSLATTIPLMKWAQFLISFLFIFGCHEVIMELYGVVVVSKKIVTSSSTKNYFSLSPQGALCRLLIGWKPYIRSLHDYTYIYVAPYRQYSTSVNNFSLQMG